MDTAYRRLLHQERCFEQVLRISPLALLFIVFFIYLYLSFVFIASVLLGFGESGLLFLSGKHSPTVVHTTHYRLWTFSFIYHNTTWLDPGRVFGRIYNWQGPDTGGLFHFGPFPSVIFGSQEKDVHAAMHDARL